MPVHFLRDCDRIKRDLLALGGLVEEAVDEAIAAVMDRRAEMARLVIDGDDRIDSREVAIEEECLKALALHHPVAADLRFVVAMMKVTSDLERMGDHAVSIAERALAIAGLDPLPVTLDFRAMAQRVGMMVRESLDALVRLDVDLAQRVSEEDRIVDAANRGMFDALETLMQERPETVPSALHHLSASRHLERIADLATNIAEDVVFMVSAEVVRHRSPSAGVDPT
jgi:phosphate transport system protein